jgi:hypothetical protein
MTKSSIEPYSTVLLRLPIEGLVPSPEQFQQWVDQGPHHLELDGRADDPFIRSKKVCGYINEPFVHFYYDVGQVLFCGELRPTGPKRDALKEKPIIQLIHTPQGRILKAIVITEV